MMFGRTLCLSMFFVIACTQPPLPKIERIEGPGHITFACIDEATGEPAGTIEGCGCHVFDTETQSFRTLGPVECLCVTAGGVEVPNIEAATCDNSDELCPIRGEAGDWVPSDESAAQTVSCEPQGVGKVAALVASEPKQSLTVMLIDQADTSNKLLDASEKIPGQTSHRVDDLQVGLFYVPKDRIYFSVLGLTGRIAVFDTALAVLPSYEQQLNIGTIADAEVWQHQEQDTMAIFEDALFVLTAARHTIYEYALNQVSDRSLESPLPVRCYTIEQGGNEGCERIDGDFDANLNYITTMAIDPNGRWIGIGLSHTPMVLTFDREDPSNSLTTSWETPVPNCEDPYIFTLIDDACRTFSDCYSGADENGDGRFDAQDTVCTTDTWRTPDCFDGVDNDGDGLIDRADPGCDNFADRSEVDQESGPDCVNRIDDDLDGLTDQADPGCGPADLQLAFQREQEPECSDGIDNDGDGNIDYNVSDGDSGCSHASDRSELSHQPARGVRSLKLSRPPEFGEQSWQINILDEQGNLYAALYDAQTLVSKDAHSEALQLLAQRNKPDAATLITMDWTGNVNLWAFGQTMPLTS
ncbi:MAG: hypothetical protein ACPGQS_13650, partial [Bradymonadia bacterium]